MVMARTRRRPQRSANLTRANATIVPTLMVDTINPPAASLRSISARMLGRIWLNAMKS